MLSRLRKSVKGLAPEQRLVGALAFGLFATMLLPWYSRSGVGVVDGKPVKVDDTLNAFAVFSFVEAAVLLVAIGILFLLFQRGERRAFHLPGGDGTVIAGAGIWVCLLVFYRQFDQPDPDRVEGLAVTTGVTWGIFITFLVAAALAAAGVRMRQANTPEPPMPGEPSTEVAPVRSRRPRAPRTASTDVVPREEAATDVTPPSEKPTTVAPPEPPATPPRRRRAREPLFPEDGS